MKEFYLPLLGFPKLGEGWKEVWSGVEEVDRKRKGWVGGEDSKGEKRGVEGLFIKTGKAFGAWMPSQFCCPGLCKHDHQKPEFSGTIY